MKKIALFSRYFFTLDSQKLLQQVFLLKLPLQSIYFVNLHVHLGNFEMAQDFFFLDFLQNIKEFELAKQFEGYLSDIYAILCSKTALRRLKTYGFAFGLEFRPICMANFKRLLFGLLFSRIWAKFCSDRLVTLTSCNRLYPVLCS